MNEHLFIGDTTYPHTPSEATIKVEIDSKRADALAAVIKDLCRLVTSDYETKQDFIDSVKKVLGDDPDMRVSRLHDRIEQLERDQANLLFAMRHSCIALAYASEKNPLFNDQYDRVSKAIAAIKEGK